MDWDSIDIVEALQPLVAGGQWYWRADNGKLDQLSPAIESRVPWVYWNNKGADCFFSNDVLFGKFGLLPSTCANCYKVVVVPTTADELFQVCDIQEQLAGLPCKCGVEIRDDVPRNYGAYWYNEGLEQGRKCYGLVRGLMDKYVGTHIRVGLKRACTEMERQFGPSDKWEIPEGQLEFERKVRTVFTEQPRTAQQTDQIRKHVKNKWIKFAHSRGDMSYLKYTGGTPLYPPYVLYDGQL